MEYKFRAKRKDNHKWVEGSLSIEFDGTHHISYWVNELIESENNYWEMVHKMVEVLPDTIGQFTTHELGLYVGDIVNYVTGSPSEYVNAVVEFGDYETYTLFNKEEGDVEKHIGFYINDGESKIPVGSLWLAKIGNIHDNPELLNPAGGQSSVDNMLYDPNVKAEEATEQAANAQESASQDAAVGANENSEEGTTEG